MLVTSDPSSALGEEAHARHISGLESIPLLTDRGRESEGDEKGGGGGEEGWGEGRRRVGGVAFHFSFPGPITLFVTYYPPIVQTLPRCLRQGGGRLTTKQKFKTRPNINGIGRTFTFCHKPPPARAISGPITSKSL